MLVTMIENASKKLTGIIKAERITQLQEDG
jgi:hypothetical protein